MNRYSNSLDSFESLLHLEPSVKVDDALVAEVKSALRACAAWHKTPQVVRYATEPGFAKRLSD